MSMNEDLGFLQQTVGRTVVNIRATESFQDDNTSSVVLTFDDGSELHVSSRGFCDGSSCLTVDVTQ